MAVKADQCGHMQFHTPDTSNAWREDVKYCTRCYEMIVKRRLPDNDTGGIWVKYLLIKEWP